MSIPDSERRLASSLAAHESWAKTENRAARTAPARAALDKKFLDTAGGDPVRAAHLRKAHFARLALKSARSRRKARELSETADTAKAELSEAADVTVVQRVPVNVSVGVEYCKEAEL